MESQRAAIPLEFCALSFLLQWLNKEEALYEAIRKSNPTDEDIRKALAYFQVSRNFKGLNKEPGKVSLIRDALLETRRSQPVSDAMVEALASTLQQHFGQANLSAASKLLWLSFRKPFVIYDKRAVDALSRKFKQKFSLQNYVEYAKAWRSQYADWESAIGAAVEELPRGRMFMPACRLTDGELLRLGEEAWFKERVFDIFLWEVGGEV